MSDLGPTQVSTLLREAGAGATIYLIGAGGCGVSGLAHLLLDDGFRVHGSDMVENEEVRQLRQRGAIIHTGHASEYFHAAQPVLVAYSPAIRPKNPELEVARACGVPTVRRAILLAALASRQRAVCVAGMHGKTTTAALLAYALTRLGVQPSWAIGALVPQMPAHAHFSPGERNWFVVEADESDGSLRYYQPTHSIVLNVDDEHLDYFTHRDAVSAEFEQFVANTRESVIFCADDERVAEIAATRPGAVSYGFHALAQYRVVASDPNDACGERASSKTGPGERVPAEPASQFTVWHRGEKLGAFCIRLLGEKNISNATAVIALLHQMGFPVDAIHEAIKDFIGAVRRQEKLFADSNVQVFDDYAHHPNEILATLRAFKEQNPRRLVVVFQPHRYTRTQHLMADFAAAFGDADKLFLTDVYGAGEPEIPGANGAALADAIRARGGNVEYIAAWTGLVPAVRAALHSGDLVLFVGAGDITKAAHELARVLKAGGAPASPSTETMSMNDIGNKLRAAVSAETVVRQDEPLAKRTTLRVGGKADYFAEPANEQDLAALLRLCGELKLPFTMVGRGSNLLIRDGGIRGVVISLGHENFSRVQIIGEHLHCGAGARLKTISVEARRAGLAGLEFLEGIPGSVGGSLRMNAGAMGSWMFEVVEQIRFMDFFGVVHERKASEVNVEYRGCPLFKTHVALGAVLRGTPSSKEVIQGRANQYNSKRWETQPAQPSAGCIFKNPKTVPAGKLIDELGLKGTKRGGAMVSTVHGNFIVNDGGATAKDVLELIDFIKQKARAERGIELETEVEIIGE